MASIIVRGRSRSCGRRIMPLSYLRLVLYTAMVEIFMDSVLPRDKV
jgi:hypothetical protein